MRTNSLAIAAAVTVLLTGCASTFTANPDNTYGLSKKSAACSIGSSSSLLAELRAETIKFCAGQRGKPVELSVTEVESIPAVRCASAHLHFKCEQLTQ